jgi:Tfp pilus assembly protein PilN
MTGIASVKKLTSFTAGSAEKLKRMGNLLRRVFTFNPADELVLPRKNLSVVLEKGGVSVAFGAKLLSRITVKRAREYSFAEGKYPQPEEVVSSLVLARNEFGTARTEVTLCIPKSWAIIKTAEFPSTVKENLPAVVSYEIDRLTPFAPDEAFFDFRVIADTGERVTLLVMVARADMITPYLAALSENGFEVGGITVDLAAMCSLCRYADKKSDAIFLGIDGRGYEGALSHNGSIIQAFSNTFITDDENGRAEKISSEIASLADTARSRGGSPRVFAYFKDKNPSLQELLKLRTSSPFTVLGGSIPGLRISTPSENLPFAAVGSLMQSLWPKADGFNLLQKGLREERKTPVFLSVVLLAAILSMAALYMIRPLRVEKDRLRGVESQLALKKEEVKKIEALKKDIEALQGDISTIRQFKANRPSTLDLLKELTVVIPKSTWLSHVRIAETTVNIEGHSPSSTELLPKLESSRFFAKAEFASPTFRDRKTGTERFNIKMELEGVRKLEDVLKKETEKPEAGSTRRGNGNAGEALKNGQP